MNADLRRSDAEMVWGKALQTSQKQANLATVEDSGSYTEWGPAGRKLERKTSLAGAICYEVCKLET